MSRIIFVGNFSRESVGEPEIAAGLEAEGHEVIRVTETEGKIAEVEDLCRTADILLFSKCRIGSWREVREMFSRISIPKNSLVIRPLLGNLTMFKPLGTNVLVRPLEEAGNKAGIVIVEKDKPVKGSVVSVGELVTDVQEGDTVLFTKYSPDDIEIDGEKLLVLDESAILATIG
jgi:chaperonin GroES